MENSGKYVSFSLGVPNVVVGCLLAIKFARLSTITYTDIIWYGIKVWLACAAITLVLFLIIAFIIAFVRKNHPLLPPY